MFYKRTIPLIIVFVTGLLAFVHEFVPHPISAAFREEMTTWFRIIGGFGMFIGVYSLLHMHTMRVRRQQAGWGYSAFVFLGAAAMIVAGIVNEPHGPLGPAPEDGTMFDWFYMNVQVPCGATIFSLLAFFMASAAFRTFRARNIEAALLLVAAVIVMFGRVPLSAMISDAFPRAADVLLECPNLAAKRGILLGVSLGAISQSLRILFGIERTYMGGGGD
ncbi:MAG TPA: hypothetical protein VNE39_01315 [Planctomycetota bacterium]|nr:hypothetical protein [Planctomycetota bacterium]